MSDRPLKVISGSALSAAQKKDLMHRLARVEGQLRGIQKLVANAAVQSDCDGVAQQMSAARKAIDRAFVTLLTSALVTHTAGANNVEDATLRAQHLSALLDRYA